LGPIRVFREKLMAVNLDALTQTLERMRTERPVVHVITNWVTAGDVANVLHVAGARPIMAASVEEVEEIVSCANALVLNLGTPDPSRLKAMLQAGRCANSIGLPVIFDPVGAGASRFRTEAARTILSELRIAVIRGNEAEIGGLACMGGKLRGIDSVTGPPDLRAAAGDLSLKTGAVIAVTGPQDLVVGSGQAVVIENGHPMMARITGMGCCLSALLGAFAAVQTDIVASTVGAISLFGLAGERAALQSQGPGTFKGAFLDAIYSLTPEEFQHGVRLKDPTV
jgi:hydroxyethylthiazole kinase